MGQLAFDANTGPTLRSYAPARGVLLGEVAVTAPAEVAAVVARARKAQRAWAVLPALERAGRLLRLHHAIAAGATRLVEIVTAECGKPRQEALLQEIVPALDHLGWVCRHAPRLLADEKRPLHLLRNRTCVVRHEPKGVVGVLSPWNYPLAIPMVSIAEALAAGNACVVKPSEVTPLLMRELKAIFDATGLPEDLLGVVYGRGETGQALLDAGIDHCVFTGSVETGRKVAAACGERLVPCTMELGGKAALLACEDCDVERTARAIVWGGFTNAGQACISVERVYAHQRVYGPLLERAERLTRELRAGDPARDFVDVGALTFAKQVDVARRHVEDAVRKGARVVCGGVASPGPGQAFEPTVLADCDPTMTVMREEIFGPIVPFMRVGSDDEALRLANDSALGLNAYIFTRSRSRGRELAARLEAGGVVVNDVLSNYAAAEAPFGGVKRSGFGRVHGPEGLLAMTQPKTILMTRFGQPTREPYWYPYSARSFHWLERGARALFAHGLRRRLGALL